MQEYEAREFDEVEVIYSSIVYLYDISRVVKHVAKTFIETQTWTESLIDTADAKVAIWQSLLPSCKQEPLRPDGTVDEVLFLAHMCATM
jgi:hypothetical protein